MSIKPHKFVRRGHRVPTAPPRQTEKGYILGSHIRKGLYEPVNPEISGLLRNTYDEDASKHSDVDPLNSYRMDKFEKAIAMRVNSDVPSQTTPPVEPTNNNPE